MLSNLHSFFLSKRIYAYDESNGIVESKVNTTKLTKRIMYGRSSFELIKNKTMRLQSLRQ